MLQQADVDMKAGAFDHLTWSWGCATWRGAGGGGGTGDREIEFPMVIETHNVKRVRKIQEMGPKRRNVNGIFRHKLRWGGSWGPGGLRFEPDFSNVESRKAATRP